MAEMNQRFVKAMAHPLRFKILTLLNEGVSSPKVLSDRLGEPLGTVSYHVRILADLGCAELVSTRPRRGALEHYYRATIRPTLTDEDWRGLPASVRRSIVGDIVQRAWSDVAAAADGGTLDEGDTHVSRTDLILDEEGAEELKELLGEVLERAMEIAAESAGRHADGVLGAEVARDTRLIMMHFDAPGGPRSS
jgi:DNA-binding transcriptional ArsR family regulator